MTVKYKTLITTAGAAKFAAATAGGTKITLTQMAVGDGGGTLPVPDVSQTKLIGEKWRAALNKISVDARHDNYVVAELVIPPEVGGFWLREMGLYDADGTLVAVASMAESYKPELAEGSGRAQTLRMVIIVSAIESVDLTIDTTTVMATQEYVDDKLAEHERSRRHPDATLTEKGFTQLSSATDSESEVLAATPKAVKTAYDLADRADKNADGRLAKNSNLSDVQDKAKARDNLGLKGAAMLDVGSTAGTVAAGNDTRIVNALQKGNNLSDVADKSLARSNLELKTAALSDVQTSRKDVTPGRVLMNGGTFVVGENQVTVHAGNAGFQFGSNGIFNAPDMQLTNGIMIGDTDSGFAANGDGSVKFMADNTVMGDFNATRLHYNGDIYAVNGGVMLQQNLIQIKGTGNKHLWFYSPSGIERGLLYASDDNVIHMRANAGPSLDVNAAGEVTVNGPQIKAPYFRAMSNPGMGGFAYQLGVGAAFYRDEGSRVSSDNTYFPLCKGRVVLDSGFPVAYSFGYVTAGKAAFGALCIQAKTDAPDKDRLWQFHIDTGAFTCPGDITGNYLRAGTAVLAGNATFGSDGNAYGSIWGGYLSTWLSGQLGVRDTAINNLRTELVNWGNGSLTNALHQWTSTYFVQDVRLASEVSVPIPYNGRLPAGYVCVASTANGGDPGHIIGSALQKNVNGTWYTVGKV